MSVIYSVFNTTKNYTNICRDELCVILQILIGQFPKTRVENWFLFFFEINYFTKNWKVAFKMETVKQQWLLSWNNVFHTHISAQKKRLFLASPVPTYFNLIRYFLYILFNLCFLQSVCYITWHEKGYLWGGIKFHPSQLHSFSHLCPSEKQEFIYSPVNIQLIMDLLGSVTWI